MNNYRFVQCGLLLLMFLALSGIVYGQPVSYSGRIVDTEGKPLVGINIRWIDQQIGTVSDSEGKFVVRAAGNVSTTLRISGIGFVTLDVPVNTMAYDLGDIILEADRLNMGQVVVTATRKERSLEAIPLPVTVVGQEQIRASGALRLSDILSEQIGMTIVSDHGTGLQMQGFDPEYTLILIDGEPVIGRSAGTLDLTRIALGNVEQIEIVKGPSSSLYGSDALAGVVNIITRRDSSPISGFVTSSYSTHNILDSGAEIRVNSGNFSASVFGNLNRSDGYDLSPDTRYATIPKFINTTFRGRLAYTFSPKVHFRTGIKYYDERQRNQDHFSTADRAASDVKSYGTQYDWSATPELQLNLARGFNLAIRQNLSGYYTHSYYEYESDLQSFEHSKFDQNYFKTEAQADYALRNTHLITAGAGTVLETLEADRYNDRKNKMRTHYAFAQHEWTPAERLNVIWGFRFDAPDMYTERLSPRLSASWKFNGGFLARGSVGAGFKAPDFRQMFLNFTNPSVGYTVLGTADATTELKRLVATGIIDPSNLYVNPDDLGEINPENSRSINIGGEWRRSDVSASVNVFHNEVHDLIETMVVAIRSNGQSVYSYRNFNQVQMRGVETAFTLSPVQGLEIGLGYQLLLTRDMEVYNRIKEGKVFRRNSQTGATELVKTGDYGGLANRSKHSGTVKVSYFHAPSGVQVSARSVLRGRFGFADRNSNGIIDDDAEYAKGYALVNLHVSKDLPHNLNLFAGANNLTGYTDSQAVPSLSGRTYQVGLRIQFTR